VGQNPLPVKTLDPIDVPKHTMGYRARCSADARALHLQLPSELVDIFGTAFLPIDSSGGHDCSDTLSPMQHTWSKGCPDRSFPCEASFLGRLFRREFRALAAAAFLFSNCSRLITSPLPLSLHTIWAAHQLDALY
jgi:hypothetical protein